MVRELFLAWQDTDSRRWYTVGRFTFDPVKPLWEFRYLQGALQAQEQAGFDSLTAFSDFYQTYRSEGIFPILQNRLMSSRRGDYDAYLAYMGFDPANPPDEMQMLARSGGRRATDNLELFPLLEPRSDGSFEYEFFLRRRHLRTEEANQSFDREALCGLSAGQALQLAVELNNPGGYQWAIQLQTRELEILGYTPNYLVDDLRAAFSAAPETVSAEVVCVSPPPAPRQRRVLLRVKGQWPEGRSPMSGKQFLSLPGAV